MAKKTLLSVGFRFPGDLVPHVRFNSGQSLFDADIMVFAPDISPYLLHGGDSYYESTSQRAV